MEAKAGTPESASKMASLPFLRPVFLQKTASFYANIGRAVHGAACLQVKMARCSFTKRLSKKESAAERE
jgi:hypothetical protein